MGGSLAYRIPMVLACVLLAPGCNPTAQLGESRYRVPPGNLLSNTLAAEFVGMQYGSSRGDGELGLVFSGNEVAAAIPGYSATVRGYQGLVDDSPSVVISKPGTQTGFDDALADEVERLAVDGPLARYRDTGFGMSGGDGNSFALLEPDGSWQRNDMMPPVCRRNENPDGSERDSCTLAVRRNGLRFSFIMNGENVGQADSFVGFVLARLKSWEVSSGGRI